MSEQKVTPIATPAAPGAQANPTVKVFKQSGGLTPSVAAAKAEAQAAPEKPAVEASEAGDDSTAKPEPRLADPVDRANRAAAREREKDKQLKQAQAQIAELSKHEAGAKQLAELLDEGGKEPIKAIAKLLKVPEGDVVQFIADTLINGGKRPGVTPEAQALAELQAKEKAREEREAERQTQAQSEQQAAQITQAQATFLACVNPIIAADPDAFELTVMHSQHAPEDERFANLASEDAWDLSEAYYNSTGRIIEAAELARRLEAYYESVAEERYRTLASSKKLKARFGIGEQRKAAEQSKPAAAKEAPTLGGRKLAPEATSSKAPPKFKNDKERMEYAMAVGRRMAAERR